MAAIKNSGQTVAEVGTEGGVALPNIPGNAQRATICCIGQAVRFRTDGGAPTASVGTLMSVGSTVWIWPRDNLQNFKAIEVTDGASLYVEYFDHVDG
jgi:hypothetical protein